MRHSLNRLAFLCTSWIALACTSPTPASHQLEYRLAIIEDDVLGSHPECDVEDGETYGYRYPAGMEVTIRAAAQPVFTLSLDESVSVTFVDWGEIEEGQGRAVVANVVPRAQELQEANEVRQIAFRCDVLVMVDGLRVGIEPRGRNWDEGVPGGTFASISEAERAYSGSSVRISREVAPENERKAQQDWWKWRRQRDLWDFHCDASIREYVRSRDLEIYEALQKTAPPDCEQRPEEPARWPG